MSQDINSHNWAEASYDMGAIEGYLSALNVDRKETAEVRKILEKMKEAMKDRNAKLCNGLFLHLNERLIRDLNIPPIID